MNRCLRIIAALILLAAMPAMADAPVRFASVDVYIDVAEPMAAWQLEFAATTGGMQVVGVENGDSKAFDRAPYYDRDAVETGRADRIVVADYSLENKNELPSGRVRVTTLHLMLSGTKTPEFDARLIVATSHLGTSIDAEISIEISEGSKQ